MPGMNSGSVDPAVAAAFRAALLRQGLVALLIAVALGAAWMAWRARRPARPGPGGAGPGGAGPGAGEPGWRRLLRIGFGLLWLFDGILQAQPAMPTGMVPQVIEPTAASSPPWVQHLSSWGGGVWTHHLIPASTAAVWIQVGLGLALLAAPAGAVSRLAGLASVGWGLVVWVFGESFGGIFTQDVSWLTGAPGAVAFYVAAGALIALPERAWRSPRAGKLFVAALGLFLAVMAGLQARPGAGFWQGSSYGQPGSLAAMVQSMSRTPQPRFLSGWLSAFGAFDEAHGFAVNLFVVAALTVAAAACLSGRPRPARLALAGLSALCLADWVLVQDLGFLGGVGTDPNSMIPFILLAAGGYLALVRVQAPAAAAPSLVSRLVHRPLTAGSASARANLPSRNIRPRFRNS
jgi:hypothetical protein